MSSGNPFGLSEISHFGAFQRVGGKAGGFINKKFFHPSSMRNQEKLWQAQTADEREQKKQTELEKRREEERQVEDLRKQMYLSGQGKQSDFANTAVTAELSKDLGAKEKTELHEANNEMRRRKSLLKQERATREAGPINEDDEDEEEEEVNDGQRKLATSRYNEDVRTLDHRAVWGSWYSLEDKAWGFGCCRGTDRTVACPEAPDEDPEASPDGGDARPSKRRRRAAAKREAQSGSAGPSAAAAAGDPHTTVSANATGATASSTPAAPPPEESLMDNRMFEAKERRLEKKRQEELRKEEEKRRKNEQPKESGYLADLLSAPGG